MVLIVCLSVLGGGIWLFHIGGKAEETFWHLPVALFVQILMQMGYLYKKIEDNAIFKKLETIFFPICMVGFILLLIYMPMDADLRTGYFTDPYAYLVQTMVGLSILVIGCKKIAQNHLLEFIGVHSGLYYGYQMPFIWLTSALFTLFVDEMGSQYIYIFLHTVIVVGCIGAVIQARDILLCMCKGIPVLKTRKFGSSVKEYGKYRSESGV